MSEMALDFGRYMVLHNALKDMGTVFDSVSTTTGYKKEHTLAKSVMQHMYESPLPGITLELGIGNELEDFTSAPLKYRVGDNSYREDAQYVSIDGGDKEYSFDSSYVEHGAAFDRAAVAKKKAKFREDAEHMSFLIGDARHMDELEEGSVVEVYMKDLIRCGQTSNQDVFDIAAECMRVMKPGGRMFIVQTACRPGSEPRPMYSTVDSTATYDTLAIILKIAGFEQAEIFNRDNEGNTCVAVTKNEIQSNENGQTMGHGWLSRVNASLRS